METSPLVNVEFLDTTLRDGDQSLPDDHQFRKAQKHLVASRLSDLGYSVIEAGFPATKLDFDEVEEVARIVGNADRPVNRWTSDSSDVQSIVIDTPIISALCRANPRDIEITWEALKDAKHPLIHSFIATDPEHMKVKFPDKDEDDIAGLAVDSVTLTKSLIAHNSRATVEFSLEAATTTRKEFLERMIKDIVNAGVDVINLPDTVGHMEPFGMYQFYQDVIKWAIQSNQKVIVSAHNHNDQGMAVANSLSFIKAATDYASEHEVNINTRIETTICGLGERAGNCDIFPLVSALFSFAESYSSKVGWSFNRDQSVAVANEVMAYAGFMVDRQSPIVGRDILQHRSGVHSDAIIKGGHTIYSPFNPSEWGHSQDATHSIGKYQGKSGRRFAALKSFRSDS